MAGYPERTCKNIKCGRRFKPKTGTQWLCAKCRAKAARKSKKNRAKVSLPTFKDVDEGVSRGTAVSSTPLALRIDQSVAKRIERMK